MFNELNADSYKNSGYFYTKEFEGILGKIVHCYNKMIADKITLENDEERIRDCLYTKYLNKKDIRKEFDIYYNIDCEPSEYDSNGNLKGYLDLKIFGRNEFEYESPFYIIECKRLDDINLQGTTGLNAEYIKNGIQRFTAKQYSCYYRINGMIGFVVKKIDVNENINNINTLLINTYKNITTLLELKKSDFIQNFEFQYISEHKDNDKKELRLYHLMFDFSKNMKRKDSSDTNL